MATEKLTEEEVAELQARGFLVGRSDALALTSLIRYSDIVSVDRSDMGWARVWTRNGRQPFELRGARPEDIARALIGGAE